MKRVAVIHQFPLEYYPPATNLLDYLSQNEHFAVEAYSTFNPKGRPDWENPRVQVSRFPCPRADRPALLRLLDYARFILGTTWKLAFQRPTSVLYFEPNSALPAYFYKRFINSRAAIFHHCHEYTTPAEFDRPGMRLTRLAHWFEKGYLYQASMWISHTNEDRIRLFLKDHPKLNASRLHVLPNLPPPSWKDSVSRARRGQPPPLRCVYVGAVSLENTFIQELCAWVRRKYGNVTLDIYAYNITPETDSWLKGQSHADSGIRYFSQGLPYEDLPKVLPDYHVGLILYRGNTENFIWNAPNKLFEYLACGLDVWYPPVMKGMEAHRAAGVFPKVIPIDFEDLASIDLASVADRKGLARHPDLRYCDEVLNSLETALI